MKRKRSKSRSRRRSRSKRKTKKKMTEREFYCVSCRKRVTLHADDICLKSYTTKGRKTYALRGACGKCDHMLTKFVSKDHAAKLKAKYGTC